MEYMLKLRWIFRKYAVRSLLCVIYLRFISFVLTANLTRMQTLPLLRVEYRFSLISLSILKCEVFEKMFDLSPEILHPQLRHIDIISTLHLCLWKDIPKVVDTWVHFIAIGIILHRCHYKSLLRSHWLHACTSLTVDYFFFK